MLRTIALAVAVLVLPATAHADDKRPPDHTVAIISAEISGDADPELRGQLQESVRKGLTSAGYSLVNNDTLRKVLRGSELIDCTSTTCLHQISDKVGAKHFMKARVEASGAAYTVVLELLDIEGTTVRSLDQSCAVCTINELNGMVAKVAESIITQPEVTPAPVMVLSRPQGAELQIDDKPAGPSPYRGELAPGKHRVVAQLAGHAEVNRTVDVKEGTALQRFEIILTPLHPERHHGPEGPPRPFRLWKWVAGGGAVAALATGIVLISIDGNGTCSTPNQECMDRYNTMGGGLLTVGVGVAAAAASTWMFLRDRKDERAANVAIAPTRGGAFATVRLRF